MISCQNKCYCQTIFTVFLSIFSNFTDILKWWFIGIQKSMTCWIDKRWNCKHTRIDRASVNKIGYFAMVPLYLWWFDRHFEIENEFLHIAELTLDRCRCCWCGFFLIPLLQCHSANNNQPRKKTAPPTNNADYLFFSSNGFAREKTNCSSFE